MYNKISKTGERIKELRIQNNMTQSKLADKLSIDRTTLAQYELGLIIPSLDILWEIADIFDISIDELVGRKWIYVRVEIWYILVYNYIIGILYQNILYSEIE